jgi:transcriptional regulator with XRE-family HTH domain
MNHDELAGCLRSWRDRLGPAEIGLPAGGRRRASGLRREEVAQLAGLSTDYLARLEQGRAHNPSPSVDLRALSDRFDALWRERAVGAYVVARKTFDHPTVGLVTLDCDMLQVGDGGLRLIVFTAPPGSADANALALLSAVGTQFGG